MKKLFDRAYLEGSFEKMGRHMTTPVTAYLLGGGAMAFRDQKPGTKDLDLLVENRLQAVPLQEAFKQTGFSPVKKLDEAYTRMGVTGGVWENADEFRIDLFVRVVVNKLHLTETIKQRSTALLGSFGNLHVKSVSNEDVALFKSVTGRPNDTADMAAIIRQTPFNWSTLLSECALQSETRTWQGPMLESIRDLKERFGIDAPITRKLESMNKDNIIKDAYKIKLAKGLTPKEAIDEFVDPGFPRKKILKVVSSFNGNQP